MIKQEGNYLLTVSLIQQTPMIHFQHDQTGATLRATEVKPKLDRFLREKYGSDIPGDWFVKGDSSTGALNYKLRFQTTGEPEKSKAGEYAIAALTAESHRDFEEKKRQERMMRGEINGMYFANMVPQSCEKKTQYVQEHFKETVFFREPIKMTIFCMDSDLQNFIRKHLSEFFLTHNFGTRQSKGFGGFSVQMERPVDCVRILQDAGYHFFWANLGRSTPKDSLNHAMTVYAILKGGLNLTGWSDKTQSYAYPDRYIKGYIQRVFLDEWYDEEADVGSEKTFMKSVIPISPRAVCPELREPSDDDLWYADGYLFIRAILGLADKFEFRSLRTATITVHNMDNNQDIQRFPSPITIKIVDGKIIFLFDVAKVQEIVNKKFYLLNCPFPKNIKTKEQKDAYVMRAYQNVLDGVERDRNNNPVSKAWEISSPQRFNRNDVIKMLRGFVRYFNENKYKLDTFASPHKATKDITLQMGE